MSQRSLRETIDAMVEAAIRRVLPTVMTEVLLRTLASAGTLSEGPPEGAPRPRRKMKRRKPVREAKVPTRKPVKSVSSRRPGGLGDLLDPTAGSEWYADPREAMRESADPSDTGPIDEDVDSGGEPGPTPEMARRLATLPPALRGLAEDISLDDDGGEMWEPNEYDSARPVTDGAEIKDIGKAAQAAGLNFDRMKSVIGVTSPARKLDREDVRANAQFEQARIRRMREQLNGGKPIE